MIAEFYAPTREGERPTILHRDGHGERWLSIQAGTPVVYEDLAGLRPGLEPARVAGHVERVELLLLSPEPKLLVFLAPGEPTTRAPWGPSPMRSVPLKLDDAQCWSGEIAVSGGRAACRACGYLHEDRGDMPIPHARGNWRST